MCKDCEHPNCSKCGTTHPVSDCIYDDKKGKSVCNHENYSNKQLATILRYDANTLSAVSGLLRHMFLDKASTALETVACHILNASLKLEAMEEKAE